MSPSSTEIKNLLSTERYNPKIVPQLESYLVSQVEDGNAPAEYDFEANRTLVKLYQFFPNMVNFEYTTLAALLAFVYGTDAEFGAINCLIPEHAKNEEPFLSLTRAVEQRDSCVFSSFWSIFQEDSMKTSSLSSVSTLVGSNHAKTALRKSILQTLSLTFKNMDIERALVQLDFICEDHFSEFLKNDAPGIVETTSGGKVVFCDNVENTKRDKAHKEGSGITYAAIRELVANATIAAAE